MEDARDPVDYGKDLIGSPWRGLLYRWHVQVEHRPSDEFDDRYDRSVNKVRSLVYTDDFAALYTFLEFIVRSPSMDLQRQYIARALKDARAAWRLVETEIVPISSPEQAQALTAAVAAVATRGPEGAKAHLQSAARLVAAGDWPGSVRESIHAVEAVACSFEEAGSLGDALTTMGRSGKPIHPALSRGFRALYGYTSDEKGIRHALLETDAAAVSEHEALFMFGACATFCQYLLNVGGAQR